MAEPIPSPSPRTSFLLVIGILVMIAIPAAVTLHTARVAPAVDQTVQDLTPYGYTISLLLFIVPILAISIWFLPNEGVHISRKSFWRTIVLLFPLGALLDFFFARFFFMFPNPNATLRIKAPALGGGVPVEEYLFYFTGFVAVLLIYIWLDEYWLAAYSIPVTCGAPNQFRPPAAFSSGIADPGHRAHRRRNPVPPFCRRHTGVSGVFRIPGDRRARPVGPAVSRRPCR